MMNKTTHKFLLPAFSFLILLTSFSPTSSAKAKAPTSGLVAYSIFKTWSPKKQSLYLKALRQSWAQFELTTLRGVSLASEDTWSLPFGFLPEAHADGTPGNLCVIGGVRRKLVNKNSKLVCPTYGRECSPPGGGKGFKCGVIFKNQCVSLTAENRSSLTLRCAEAADADTTAISKKQYEATVQTWNEVLKSCDDGQVDPRYKRQCKDLRSRVNKLSQNFSTSPAEEAPAVIEPATKPVESELVPPGIPTGESRTNCKGLYGLVIEGTTETSGIERGFNQSAAQLAASYKAIGAQVSIVPPLGPKKTIRSPKDTTPQLKEILADSSINVCESEAPKLFMDYAFGRESDVSAVNQDTFKYLHNGRPVVDNKSVWVNEADVTQKDDLEKTDIVKKMDAQKKACGGIADQVVMVTIKDHGSKDCRIYLGNGKNISPQEFKTSILDPLTSRGARVVVNFDSCFSGCFVDQLKNEKFDKPVCLTSSTKSNTVGYGSDDLVRGTYDDTFPTYLSKLKNPLKAHICATLWDPLNTPNVTASRGLSPDADVSEIKKLAENRKAALTAIGQKFGLGNLEQDCQPSRASNIDLPGVGETQLKTLLACTQIRKGLSDALDPKTADAFLAHVTNPNSAPGVEALNQMATSDATRIGASCNLDLSAYKKVRSVTPTLDGSPTGETSATQ